MPVRKAQPGLRSKLLRRRSPSSPAPVRCGCTRWTGSTAITSCLKVKLSAMSAHLPVPSDNLARRHRAAMLCQQRLAEHACASSCCRGRTALSPRQWRGRPAPDIFRRRASANSARAAFAVSGRALGAEHAGDTAAKASGCLRPWRLRAPRHGLRQPLIHRLGLLFAQHDGNARAQPMVAGMYSSGSRTMTAITRFHPQPHHAAGEGPGKSLAFYCGVGHDPAARRMWRRASSRSISSASRIATTRCRRAMRTQPRMPSAGGAFSELTLVGARRTRTARSIRRQRAAAGLRPHRARRAGLAAAVAHFDEHGVEFQKRPKTAVNHRHQGPDDRIEILSAKAMAGL